MPIFAAIGAALTMSPGAAFLGTVAVGAGAASINASQRSAAASQAAVETQRQQAQQQAQAERRRSIRQFLMERQLRVNLAAATGLEGSSAARGGIGSLSSQLGTNLGFSSMMSGLNNLYYGQTLQAQNFAGQAELFGGISNLAFGLAGRPELLGNFFTPTTSQMGQPSGR
jgi:hypothetical protein